MAATDGAIDRASAAGHDERDVRALTQYLTVLEDVGRARGADGLYLVVSESGREYLVDAASRTCECGDHRYRGTDCKHLRRVAFATGRRPIPAGLADEVDPDLGEHVAGRLRVAATDGGTDHAGDRAGTRAGAEGRSGGRARTDRPDVGEDGDGRGGSQVDEDGDDDPEAGHDDSDDRPWLLRDPERDRVRAFDDREAARTAMADLEDLGLDLELVPADAPDDARHPEVVDPREYDLGERNVGEDPLEWLPDAFVDVIDGTPAINRKGFEVLGHFYDVDVETEVQIGPAETDFVYCQVRATATTPGGRRCQALGSAHVGRDDDPTILLELADTRARKRALSIATGVGVVAVEELTSEATQS